MSLELQKRVRALIDRWRDRPFDHQLTSNKDLEKRILGLLARRHSDGYQEGYEDGYKAGWRDGSQDAKDEANLE